MKTYKPTNGDFSFAMDIVKGNLTDEGKMIIKGLASNTEVDCEDQRFTKVGLESIKDAIENGLIDEDGDFGYVPLRSGHGLEWNDQLGWITAAEIDEEDNLWITAELDEANATAVSLYNTISRGNRHGKKKKLGMSVRGKTTQFTVEYDPELRRRVTNLNNLLVHEVSVTGAPKNPKAYTINIVKSLLSDPEYLKAMEEPMENLDITKSVDAAASESLDNERAEAAADTIVHTSEDAKTEVEALENAQDQSAARDAEAAQYVAAPPLNNEEAEVVVTPDDAATPATPTLDELAASVEQIRNAVQSLTDAITKAQTQEADVQKSQIANAVVETPVEVVAQPDNLNELVATAVADAFGKLGLAELIKDVSVVKSKLTNLADDSADKSIAVSKAKDDSDDDPYQKMRSLIADGNDSISAAFGAVFKK